MKSIKKRGFLDISFSWIFALLVGALILFGAVYFVNKAANVENSANSAGAGSSFINLLNPLQTGLETGKSILLTMPTNSQIVHQCDSTGNFGRDKILIEEYINNRWSNTGVNISAPDKYIFFQSGIQGRNFYTTSKSFEFPFKIADLIYITNADQKYCFKGFPQSNVVELQNLNQKNFEFDTCSQNATTICYNMNINCDIKVDYSNREVIKKNGVVYFEGDALMYAAIFSDKENYECEVQRLMKRGGEISKIYQTESLNVLTVGCNSPVKADLSNLGSLFQSVKSSDKLYTIASFLDSTNLDSNNKNSGCTLW